MVGQLVPAVCAAVLAWAVGGSLAGLARPITWWPLGLVAISVELLLGRLSIAQLPWLATWGHWVWVAVLGAVFLVLVRNVARGAQGVPWALAAIGVGLNLTVILANGGYMPFSQDAVEQTGQTVELGTSSAYERGMPLDATTRLAWLADVYPDPVWMPYPKVASMGDQLLRLGLASWAFGSVYGARRNRPPRLSGSAADLAAG
jgi:hypothetical protein